ncbi:hypothetical protein, partial [uncultured Prevotella sp.]|uniref:hypothetical protein n=1 Tax=uncultured Prevotella sp. TaxID=159272 RepID=UPI002616A7E3
QLFKRVLLPFLWGKGTFSVPSLKREKQFACLRKRLIDKELQDFDKVLQDIQKTFRGLSRCGQTGPPRFRGDRGGR